MGHHQEAGDQVGLHPEQVGDKMDLCRQVGDLVDHRQEIGDRVDHRQEIGGRADLHLVAGGRVAHHQRSSTVVLSLIILEICK